VPQENRDGSDSPAAVVVDVADVVGQQHQGHQDPEGQGYPEGLQAQALALDKIGPLHHEGPPHEEYRHLSQGHVLVFERRRGIGEPRQQPHEADGQDDPPAHQGQIDPDAGGDREQRVGNPADLLHGYAPLHDGMRTILGCGRLNGVDAIDHVVVIVDQVGGRMQKHGTQECEQAQHPVKGPVQRGQGRAHTDRYGGHGERPGPARQKPVAVKPHRIPSF